jgi:hypothetical protein
MSQSKRASFDVFLAHDPLDNALARAVIDRLGGERLSVFSLYLTEPTPLEPLAASVRRELRDSFSFVVLLTPTFLKSDYLPFQLGAAAAAGSPVFVLASGVVRDSLPEYLRQHPFGDLWNGLPAIAEQIRRQSRPLGEAEYASLVAAYRHVGLPVDQLLTDPTARDAVVDRFREENGRRIPQGKLVRELMRLRKSGKLPRLPHPSRQ